MEATKVVPNWRRAPATVSPPAGIEDFIARSNEYFAECADTDSRPTLTGYALAVGLPGPTSLIRLGQRVPELRYSISRCMMAIAAGYEEMIGFGNAAGPMFLLKNIPDFDPDELVGAPPIQYFNDRKEILLSANVTGVARSDSEHDGEDPLDTYIRLIQKRGAVKQVDKNSSTSTLVSVPRSAQSHSTSQPRRILTIISDGWEE